MSSEFLEHLKSDENGSSVGLTMNAHGYAWLTVYEATGGDEEDICNMAKYAFPPGEKGWKAAEEIAAALTEWVRHTKSIHQPEGN